MLKGFGTPMKKTPYLFLIKESFSSLFINRSFLRMEFSYKISFVYIKLQQTFCLHNCSVHKTAAKLIVK